MNGNAFADEVALNQHFEIGKNIYDMSFGRGCGICHDIPSNPQLAELIQEGSLNKTVFSEVLINGKNGMPKSW